MATLKKKSNAITSAELLLPPEEPSLLFAQRELIRTSGIDFEQWWDEFKTGFVNGKRSKDTNYRTALWTKPRYVDITPTTSTSGAMTIEYWPDKQESGNSYLLSGTCSDLIGAIMGIMRQKVSSAEAASGKNSKPLLKGWPCIHLTFKAEDNRRWVKYIRCVGFTENPKIAVINKNIELLKEADITRWATKIKSIFGDTQYIWRKGIECLSYSGMIARLQGIEGYAYVNSESDGVALFTAMLQIFDQKPDKDGFNYSGKTNPAQFVPKIINAAEGETKLILGKELPVVERRPKINCKFVSATLHIDSLKKPILIVQGNTVLRINI